LDSLARLLAACGIDRDSVAGDRLAAYLALLEKWNRRINLTASTAWTSLEPHIHEAIWAARFYGDGGGRHLDIGSGAGFPGIPLCILCPTDEFLLVESRERRAAFLEAVAAGLRLAQAKVVCMRIEDYLEAGDRTPFDNISWKGLRLSGRALGLLAERSLPETRYWVFHADSLPVEDAGRMRKLLRRSREERCPGQSSWRLSIFRLREERFT